MIMNESTLESVGENPALEAAADYRAEAQDCVRRNPASAVLFALGAGLLIGILVRALRPDPTPQSRIATLLDSIEDRLRDLAKPAIGKAGAIAASGAEAVQDRLRSSEARVERFLSSVGKKLRKHLP